MSAAPLVSTLQDILAGQQRFSGCDFIFTTNGRCAVSGFSRRKAGLNQAIAALNGGTPIAPWVIHDLRRTCASGMARLGIPPHVVEATLNHKSGVISGVAAVYNKFNYLPERREALEAWLAHITALGGPRSRSTPPRVSAALMAAPPRPTISTELAAVIAPWLTIDRGAPA